MTLLGLSLTLDLPRSGVHEHEKYGDRMGPVRKTLLII